MMAQRDNHPRFLAHLRSSDGARWLVARWLVAKGYSVSFKPIRYAPKREQWRRFVDDGDLAVAMRVEVKQLKRNFTCRRDWPFGENFIVCARHSFDDAQPRPYCYVIVNPAGTHAALVLASSRDSWRVEKRRDSRYDEEQDFYLAPLDDVRFFSLEEKKKSDV